MHVSWQLVYSGGTERGLNEPSRLRSTFARGWRHMRLLGFLRVLLLDGVDELLRRHGAVEQ